MLDYKNLHDYQLQVIEHITEKPNSGVFLDMGLGKTVSTLTAINQLMYEDFEINKVLVVGPKRVAESVWHAEVKNWKHLEHLTVRRIIGTAAQREHALYDDSADVYTIGRDNIAWMCAKLQDYVPFDMIIVDESSSFKNPKSVRFKALKKIMGYFKRVVLLTGTPAPNGLLDLWSQIYLLDKGERLGRTFTQYKGDYFTKHYVFNKYTPRDYAEAAIHQKIRDLCISMKAKDYLTLPPRIDNFIRIDFPSSVAKKYKAFEKESILEMMNEKGEDFEITALNAAALSNKLLQFSNGAVYDSDRNINKVHGLKINALEEILEAAQGKPVLVFWNFRHDIARINEKLGKRYNIVALKGNKEIDAWNRGEIEVLTMHPASGGHGLNLQRGGSIVVWFGLTWSLELYQQANARLYRQGQKEKTIINHIIVNGTMDESVKKAIDGKKTDQDALMSAVKARVDQYKNN